MTILNTYTESILTGSDWFLTYSVGCWIGLVIIALSITGIVWTIIKAIKEDEAGFILLTLLFIIIGAIACACTFSHETYKDVTYHQVIVDDTTTVNEFFDKYKLVSKDGAIYTVIDREIENE